MSVPEISTTELKKRLDSRQEGKDQFYLLDVRNPNEQDIALIPGTDLLIPVAELSGRLGEVEAWKQNPKDILVYCRSGGRSGMAVQILLGSGFQNCFNVAGGILSYSDNVDPSMQKY